MKISTSFLITIILVFFERNSLFIHANDDDTPFNDDDFINNPDNDIVCVDVADFFYEIVMGVTSFPEQSYCTDKEEAEIAAFLQKSINAELRNTPGTIKTNNKVCADPINSRRLLENNETALFQPDQPFLRSAVGPMQGEEENEHRRRLLRSFIYVGGGRCRFCFKDNADLRALSKSKELLPTNYEEQQKNRDLLFLTARKSRRPYAKVSDILLCHSLTSRTFLFRDGIAKLPIKWRNRRITTLKEKGRRMPVSHLVGPYVAGETVGLQVDMTEATQVVDKKARKFEKKDAEMIKEPVKEGTISFWLYAIDLPTNLTTYYDMKGYSYDDDYIIESIGTDAAMMADDPFVMFINGIKLDFNLLLSQPDVKEKMTKYTAKGSTFAGIKWLIRRNLVGPDKNTVFGPELDRIYRFEITAPLVVLSHKNQLDIDFIIKPNAKAKKYIFRFYHVIFKAARCQVTGLENSPFDDFKSVVESRLFHQLGIDLALKFQEEKGHCLYDKIPIVNVNLVQKETWKESNPQCKSGSHQK